LFLIALLERKKIKYKCSILWNSLPAYLKVCFTLKLFKENIKNHLNLLCISDWSLSLTLK